MPKRRLGLLALLLLLSLLAIFAPLVVKGKVPFPGDLLVAFFFPWNSGGFEGYDPWTTFRQLLAGDAVRQIYPWKSLAISELKNFTLPLWNPYNFSGNHLLANLQSAVFAPSNLLFLVFPFNTAWVINIVSLIGLFGVFTYLFLRSEKLSLPASLFGALAAANLAYLTSWLEIIVVAQSALPLPAALWLISRSVRLKRYLGLVFVPLLLALSLFGGHVQTTVYVAGFILFFLLVKRLPLVLTLLIIILAFFLMSIQLIPTIDAFRFSARDPDTTSAQFVKGAFPVSGLIAAFAPDYFGNPATGNYRGESYEDNRAYFGTLALLLAFLAVATNLKKVRPYLFLMITSLLFSALPLALLFWQLKIPILSSSAPARLIFVFQLSGALLAAYGFDFWLESKNHLSSRTLAVPIAFGLLALLLGVYAFTLPSDWQTVSLRNLVLPGILLVAFSLAFIASAILPRLKPLALAVVFSLALLEYALLFGKTQPFASSQFFFPSHPVFTFLQQNAGINRFYGFGTSYVDNNFATYFRVFSAEGYDPLYIRRYGELLSSTTNGQPEPKLFRSDAYFGPYDNFYRNRLFDLLGVKYILDKNDAPTSNWEPELAKFPADRYQLAWQKGKWKAYQRLTALPRFFVIGEYEQISKKDAILSRLYDPTFPADRKIILETEPIISPRPGGITEVNLLTYTPTRIEINITTDTPKLLFLSDNFFPGWQARIGEKPIPVYRANYAFRAVSLPPGNYRLTFFYLPESLKIGLALTLIGVISLPIFAVLLKKHYV